MDAKKRGKLKGFAILVFLILILGTINAAWIFYYKGTITSNIIGERGVYNISKEFDNTLSLDTINGPASIIETMEIRGLEVNTNITISLETKRNVADLDCPNYENNKDCNVTIGYLYSNGTRKLLIYKNNIDEEANFTLLASPVINILEYKIGCIENSCSQRIISTVTLEERK